MTSIETPAGGAAGVEPTRWRYDGWVGLSGALACLVAAASYSSFLLGPAAHSRLPAASSFISELEAVGQPHREFFRMTDVASGALIVVVALVLHRLLERDPLASIGCLLIALLGAASITDGTTEMGCAPSLDPVCRAKDSTVTGLLSQTFETHTLSGLAGFVGGAGGMVLLGIAVRRRQYGWGTAGLFTGLALCAVGLMDLVLLAIDRDFGLAERARALLVSTWLVGVAVYLGQRLWRGGRWASPVGRGRSAARG